MRGLGPHLPHHGEDVGGEIIEDCQERLRFHSEQLEYQSSTEHAMDYLVRNHGDTVAELVGDGTIPAPRHTGATVTQ